jgi:DDE superfamily endonuclease
VHHSPRLSGLERETWRQTDLRQVIEWLRPLSLPGVCKLLRRLHIVYKRGRASVHSPDLAYDEKLAVIAQARQRSQGDPERFPLLYEDEMTYELRPRVSRAYAPRGRGARVARQAPTAKQRRIAASIEVNTGVLIARQRRRFNVKEMYRYFRLVEKRYPKAERITIALDNWPVHFHPFVLEELAKRQSRVELLPLPTYAPWTNPTEKVWRLLVKDELNQHAFLDDWKGLQQAVTAWFAKYEQGSQALLHSVGLCPD